jgi:hypothetical protein
MTRRGTSFYVDVVFSAQIIVKQVSDAILKRNITNQVTGENM